VAGRTCASGAMRTEQACVRGLCYRSYARLEKVDRDPAYLYTGSRPAALKATTRVRTARLSLPLRRQLCLAMGRAAAVMFS
jgi:hypothetical protein